MVRARPGLRRRSGARPGSHRFAHWRRLPRTVPRRRQANTLALEHPLSRRRGGLAPLTAASSYQCIECSDRIGLKRRFVGANPADSGEAHGETRLMPSALVDRIERDLEYQALFHLAHRAEALDRVRP